MLISCVAFVSVVLACDSCIIYILSTLLLLCSPSAPKTPRQTNSSFVKTHMAIKKFVILILVISITSDSVMIDADVSNFP